MIEENGIEDPTEDVLIKGWLHQLMLLFHQPAGWPSWLVLIFGIGLAVLAGLPWWGFFDFQSTLIVAGILLIFMAGDTAVLFTLPKKQISFGPWKAQLAALAVPRTTAAMGISLVGWWVGRLWGLSVLVIIQLAGTAALIWGAVFEPFRLQVSEYLVLSDRLPAHTGSIRILHMTDLHVERITRREETVLRMAEAAKPDLILITGDYVNLSYNKDPVTHAHVRQLLSRLSAPFGVFATLGSPPVDLRETVVPIFDDLPINLMRQSCQEVDLGDGRQLVLLGLDCTHHLPTDQGRLERLMAAAPDDAPQVLLYHSPELIPQAVSYGIDLYLCGHTHGGQVRLPLIGPVLTSSQLGRKYVMGLYKNGRSHAFVSRGLGLEGLSAPRVRFLSPPEMTLITIMPKSN